MNALPTLRERLIQLLQTIYTVKPYGILFDSKKASDEFTLTEICDIDLLLTQTFEHDDEWFQELDKNVIKVLLKNIEFEGKINFLYFKPVQLIVAVDVDGLQAHFIRLEDVGGM
jgi:hypothetical protein